MSGCNINILQTVSLMLHSFITFILSYSMNYSLVLSVVHNNTIANNTYELSVNTPRISYILREKSLAIIYNGVSHMRYLKH